MRTLLKLFFLLLIACSVKAQTPPAPAGFPTLNSNGYYKIGWIQADSGNIPAYRDTNWIPKYQGTFILYQHAGVDTALWYRLGNKWVKILKQGDVPNLTATSPIVYLNGNISCPTCGTGGGGITSLNGLTSTTQTFASGSTGTDFNIVSSGSVHTFNFPTGSSSNRGLISTADWSNFNSKQPQINGTGFVVATGTSISFDNTVYYPNSNPSSFISRTGISALAPILYNSSTGVISGDTSSGITHLATQAYVLNHQTSGTITGSGNLAPLFTTSIVSNTIVFSLSNVAANSILGNNTGSTGPSSYFVPNLTTISGWLGFVPISLTSISSSPPLLYNNGTGVFSIQVANTSQNGYLSSTDWNTFNNKGTGSVTSIAVTVPSSLLTITGSPITTNGTFAFALTTQTAYTSFGNWTASTATPTFGKIPYQAFASGTPNYLFGLDGSGNPTLLKPDTLFYRELGISGDSVGWISSTGIVNFRLIRDSLGFHHVTNSDNSWTFYATGGFTDPLTTNGDIIARISGSTTRLGQGGNGTFLGVSGGVLGYYTPGGGGTVTSVGLALPASMFTVSGSPVTGSGALTGAFATQNANAVFIGDSVTNGLTPTFRSLVNKDIPRFSTWPAQTPIGTILYKDYFTTNDLANIQVNASGGTNSSVSIINGTMSVTASAPAYTNYNFFYPYYLTMLNHLQILQEFKDSVGGNGYATELRDPSIGLVGYLSGNAGASTINLLNQSGSSYASAAGPTIVIGHSYRTILTLNDSTITFAAQDLTTGGGVSTVSFNYTIANNQSPRIANIAFFAFSGIYNVTKFQVSSTDTKNANVVFVGDSKTREYTPTSWAGRYAVQTGANYPNYVIYAGTSMKITDILALKGELLSLNGQTIFLNIGSNDIRATGFTAQVQSNYTQLVNILSASGAKVLMTVLPEDSTAGGVGLTTFKNWVSATFPGNYIDLWTGMSTSNVLKAIYNAGDGIHPNQAGHNFIATTLNGSGLFSTLDPSRRSPFRTNDGVVKFEGDSLFFYRQIATKNGYDVRVNSEGNFSWGIIQDNGTIAGISTSTLVGISGAIFTISGQMGLQGASGGTLYGDRSAGNASTTGVFGQYVLGNLFRNYNSTSSKDIQKQDSIGRIIFNVAKTTSSATPSAYLDFVASDGTAGNAPIKIRAGTLLGTPENGAVEADASHIYFTAGGTRFQLDQQSGSGVTTVGAFSVSSIANGASISTNTITFGPADATNPGMVTTGIQSFGGSKSFGSTRFNVTSDTTNLSGGIYFNQIFPSTGSNFVMSTTGYFFNLLTIGADRTFTFPTLSTLGGRTFEIVNSNGGAFKWSLTNSVVDAAGNSISTMPLVNGWTYKFTSDGAGQWYLISSTGPNGIFESSSTSINIIGNSDYIFTGGSLATWTLPTLSGHTKARYYVKNAGSVTLTIAASGSDNLYDASSVASITLAPGSSKIIIGGTSFWYVE